MAAFNRPSEGNWLRNLELEGSLDYLATGLPEAGNILGDERFLDAASPQSFAVSVIIPVAALRP